MRFLPALLLAFACAFAQAQGYPTRPVKIVVAFSPGGGTDIVARVLGQKLGEMWSQQVIVENRAGARAPSAPSTPRSPRPMATRFSWERSAT